MPGDDGAKTAIQQILNIDPNAKVIVASGYSNDSVISNYQTYGFKAALAKPFDLKELNKVVTGVLRN